MNKAKLLDIKQLLELVEKKHIELPNVQRGFVWKPSQIENLWDSLLRRFPTGAIITGHNGDNSIQLLDGQQRTTSIALGFANLQSGGDDVCILRSSTKDIRIFIDMRKPDSDRDGKAYIFRVITRSHPWGYQYTDNTKPLETGNKTKALRLWKRDDPFSDGVLESAYPWDSVGPLPLNIFTRAALHDVGLEKLELDLLRWVKKVAPDTRRDGITNWLDEHKATISAKLPREYATYSIAEIYEKIKALVSDYTIPSLPLPKEFLSHGGQFNSIESNNDNSVSGDAIDKDDCDEIEQVFVRLNSGGTILGGEELNYSIIKAKIDRNLQEKIENKCKGIMKPSRLISIAFRLYQKSLKEDSINLRIKPKQFQREMRNHEGFVAFMDDKILKAGLLDKVKSVLKHGENMDGYDESIPDYRLPYPLFIKISAASQGEIMFMLMYRLLFGCQGRPDSFRYNTNEHRKMIGIILMFVWNGKDARSRHNKLLEKVWAKVKTLPFKKMWGMDLIVEARGEDELKSIPKNCRFFSSISSVQRNTKIWARCAESEYKYFVYNVMCNRDIILWIQREFLSTSQFFKEDLFRLDDTDVPFDWDHISPNNLVKGKQNIPDPLKDIYQQPCNLRAWPYRLNRSDQDNVPFRKFSLGDMDEHSLLKSAIPGSDDSHKDAYLLKNSFCEKGWKEFDDGWLRGAKISDAYWKNVYHLILERWKGMFKELSRELLLNELAIK